MKHDYQPGSAQGIEVQKDGDDWTLAITRELKHSPDNVWSAITDPEQLRLWAPFDASGSLADPNSRVTLTTVGAPSPTASDCTINILDPKRLLQYNWGDQQLRWELLPTERGTTLKLWAKINRNFIAMGAAGWHICFDVLGSVLDSKPIDRITGPEALRFEGWQRLNREYSDLFGIQVPTWLKQGGAE